MKMPEGIYRLEDPGAAAPLFSGRKEVIVDACLQGLMGGVYGAAGNMDSAAAVLGDFCFLAGKPEERLIAWDYGRQYLLLIPPDEAWRELIKKVLGNRAREHIRYAIKREDGCFERGKLKALTEALPRGITLSRIQGELYEACLKEEWSRDLVSCFYSCEAYEDLGLGVAALRGKELLAGASSYARSRDAIEIEIDTRKDMRNQGLASACGAALILECLAQGLYPSWDAHTEISAALAEKLGYHVSHPYVVYEVETDKGSAQGETGGCIRQR